MRVLIASNACPPRFVGGAELMAHEQAKALALLGHDVRVFAGDLGSPAPRHDRTDDIYDGVTFHRIATIPQDYSPEYLNFLHPRVDKHFREIMNDFRPDIVHCHNLMGLSVKLPIIARQQGAGVVCTLHDFWGFCLRNTAVRPNGRSCDDATQCRTCLPRLHDGRELHIPLRFRKDFMRLALDQVDRFIAPSSYVAHSYVRAGLAADHIVVIPNGVDIARFRPVLSLPPTDSIRITYAGYFGAHKGVATLLEAIAQLADRNVLLQLAGEGPEENAYRAQIAALGIIERVRFLGKVQPEDMPGIYKRSEIIVLPSIWDENQPVCLMEAMAAGLPIVASRKGGIPELIEHGRNGLMFAAGNAPDLAAQLSRLVDDPDLRRTAGAAGRHRVEGLSHSEQAARLLDIYTEVVRSRPETERRRDVLAVIGSLDTKLADEEKILADWRMQAKYLMPLDWIKDCTPTVKGFVVTGQAWRLLRHFRIVPIFALPAAFGSIVNVFSYWISRRSQ